MGANKCKCDPGWQGVVCADPLCPNDCGEHGTCDKLICKCESGWEGVACQNQKCGGDCFGNGECINGTCKCRADGPGLGFNVHTDCATLMCPKGNSHYECSGHGVCSNGTCMCGSKYQGPACGAKRCPNDCSDAGLCNATTGKCSCAKGYSGDDCSFRTCPKKLQRAWSVYQWHVFVHESVGRSSMRHSW